VLVTIIALIVAFQFVGPAPPKHIVLGSGSAEGSYHTFGKAYSEILAREAITLEVKATAGSAENIELLEAESGGIDVAFVQGGTGALATSSNLLSLGSLYFEPMWFFHRADLSANVASEFKGTRIAVGRHGSGTRVLSMQVLELLGLASAPTVIVSEGGLKAAEMLLEGRVDGAFFVTSYRSPLIKMLVESREVRLAGVDRAKAFTTRYRYLSEVILPEGVIDLQENIPSRDISLLAPAAQLVVREDFHPALVDLLLQAAREIHEAGGMFETPGEFPSPRYLDFPLSKEARRFYRFGPPFLQRYLPFWVAIFLSRMKVMLLPLLALLYPLFKLMPPFYRWTMRSRIYRWYSELESYDPDIRKDLKAERLDEYLTELDRIEGKVSKVSIPLSYSEELYAFRLHVDMLRKKLRGAHKERKTLETQN
jgi:TRAP transporter TAXI family solute receptor